MSNNLKSIPLAKQLPDSTSFPRYVAVGQAVSDCVPDSRGKAVRLSTRCWISTARWNEIAANAASLGSAMATAITQAQVARAAGKAQYADVCQKLDEVENPGFQSRRTILAVHAAKIAGGAS